MSVTERILDFLLSMYAKIFNAKPTAQARMFIESLTFVFIATGISKGILFAMNIIAGRLLGPTTYGEYTLVISVTSFLMIPLGLGVMGGLIKSLAPETNEKRRKAIISTAANYFLLTLVVLTSICLLLRYQIAAVAKIGPGLMFVSIALMVAWGSYSLLENIFKGLHRQKLWSLFTIISYAMAAAAFAYLFLSGQYGIMLILIPTFVIYCVFVLCSILPFARYYSVSMDRRDLADMFKYGVYVLIISIATTFLGNVDKLMLNYFLGAESVGIYQAYYFSSIMIVGVLTGVFINVFLPTAMKIRDVKGLKLKLDRVAMISMLSAIILVPVLQFVIIKLYGYDYSLKTSLLFMIATIMDIGVVLYSALYSAQSVDTIKKTTVGITAAFLLNIPLNYVLIPLMGIDGSIIATAISFATLLVYIRHNLKKEARN